MDEGGNQRFGFYRPDDTPRPAAVYLHNLTTILADNGQGGRAGRLAYTLPDEPPTVHDLLLQKSDGAFALVVWSERVQGRNEVAVCFAKPQSNVSLYDPTVGTEATAKLGKTDKVSLSLTDHPVVIEIP